MVPGKVFGRAAELAGLAGQGDALAGQISPMFLPSLQRVVGFGHARAFYIDILDEKKGSGKFFLG